MKIKYLLLFFFFMLRGISFSQSGSDNNLEAANKLIDDSFTSIGNKLLILGKESFYQLVYDPGNNSGSYITDRFRNRFNNYKLIINEDSDSIDYKIVFKNPLITTKYKKIFTDDLLGVKKVVRETSVSYDSEITAKDSSGFLFNQSYSKKAKDNIALDQVSNLEDNRYEFSRSDLPEENTLNQILFPAIIISVSALAIILFFSIRSK